MTNGGDVHDALQEARECCRRIAVAIEQTSNEAEKLGDTAMLERLNAARAAADRAGDLLAKLDQIIEVKE